MQIDVNGTTLWFDVDGPALGADGAAMRQRPTVILLHGGPGSYDHSYLKPFFSRLTEAAQVVYLDLRYHGRSARGDPSSWSFEACADDLVAFCSALGIEQPILLGHSMGGFVAISCAARHRAFAGSLVLLSTAARHDADRVREGFRRVAGEEVARLADQEYSTGSTTAEEWAKVYAAFGPSVPTADERRRTVFNRELGLRGVDLLRRLDLIDQLARIACPTLVCVGELDPVTPVGGVARDRRPPGARHRAPAHRARRRPFPLA